MAEKASWPSSSGTQQQESLQEALHFNRASGSDHKARADHQHKPDLKHPGPAERQRQHTPELSTAERTRSPRRSEEGSAQGQEPQPLTIKFEGKGPSKSKTDQDGTPCRYHEPDATPGPPAPATPLGGADAALTPPWMFPPAGWNKDGRRTG